MGLRLSANKENRASSVPTLPEASERYQVLSQSCLSMTSERWENNLKGSKPQSFPVSRSRHQIKKSARDHYIAGQYFFNGGAYFFFLRGAALLPRPPPKSIEPRPKFACQSKISQNQNFIFVADRFLLEPLPKMLSRFPIRPNKKRSSLLTTPNL